MKIKKVLNEKKLETLPFQLKSKKTKKSWSYYDIKIPPKTPNQKNIIIYQKNI